VGGPPWQTDRHFASLSCGDKLQDTAPFARQLIDSRTGVVLPRNRFDSKASPDSRRTSLMLHLPSDKSSRHHPPIFQRLFSKRLSSANAHLVKKIRVVMVNTYKHGWV